MVNKNFTLFTIHISRLTNNVSNVQVSDTTGDDTKRNSR